MSDIRTDRSHDQFPVPSRLLNADETLRGLFPFVPELVALKASRLLLSEIVGCLRAQKSFALESTLSGMAQVDILKRAKSRGYLVVIF
jgi:predicted ABC-type ATPase